MVAHPESYLHTLAPTLDAVNGKTAFDGKRAGDPVATQVVDEFIEMLAVGVASLIQLLQPQVVCIGGGIAKEGEYLLEPLRERVRVLTYADTLEENPVIVGATLGNDAGIIGAAV
jgi:glucokinase